MDPTQIQGLPPGSTVSPITPPPAAIPGLPPGSTVTPLTPPAAATPAPAATPTDDGTPPQTTGLQDLVQQGGEAIQGFKKGLNQTGETGMKLLHAVPGVGTLLDKTPGWQSSQAQTHAIANQPDDTVAGKTGETLENIAEWMGGDEALKGLTYGQKLAKLAPVIKLAEKFPRLAEALNIGIKTAAGSGVQAAAHGASAKDAAEAAAVGGAGGAVIGGGARLASDLIEHIAPTVENVGGRDFVRTASQGENPTAVQKAAVSADDAGVARRQQPVAQQVLSDAAKTTTAKNLGEVNAKLAGETENQEYLRQRFGGADSAAASDEAHAASVASKQADVPAAVQRTGSLIDSANELKDAALSLDDAKIPKDLRQNLREAENAASMASDEDAPAAEKRLEDVQNQIDESLRGNGATTADVDARLHAWHKQFIVRKAGNAIERSFNLTPQTADDIRVSRLFDPKQAQRNLTVAERQTDAKYGAGTFRNTIGPDAVANMHKVFNWMGDNKQNAISANRGIHYIAKVLAGEAIAGGAGAALGHGPLAAGGLAVGLAAKQAMHAIAVNPKIGPMFVHAIQYGARPAMYAPMIGRMIRDNQQEQEPPPDEPEEKKPLTMLGDEADDSAAANTATAPADNVQAQADAAIANTPASVQQAYHAVAPTVVQGQALTGRGGNAADASVDQGAGNNTIEINDQNSFQRHPASTTAHELVHTWQNNLPPTVQAKIPADPQDMSAFDISDADKLRAQGNTLATIPREKAATIVQKYIEDPKKNNNLKVWVNDLSQQPLSSTMPTAPNTTRLNMQPRAPGVPGADVAGMEALYTPRRKK
jgi:hypothetical protein